MSTPAPALVLFDIDGTLIRTGGAGVREVTFVALLTPALGAGPAIGLSLASRLVLTLTEAAGGIAALVWTRSSQGVSR